MTILMKEKLLFKVEERKQKVKKNLFVHIFKKKEGKKETNNDLEEIPQNTHFNMKILINATKKHYNF